MTSAHERQEPLRDTLAQHVRSMRNQAIKLSTRVHELAELGHSEHESVGALENFLTAQGFAPVTGCFDLETALYCSVGNDRGPTVALFAEYDALPEIGHGCGHNLICASSAVAFSALAHEIDALGGRIVIIGSPAEETGNCKELLVQSGGLDDIDIALMCHPFGEGDYLDAPYAGLRELKVAFRGEASHAAAAPESGRNALDAAVLCYQSIAALRQHLKSTDKIHAILPQGGRAVNVIPDYAEVHIQLRSDTVQGLRDLAQRVDGIVLSSANATETVTERHWDPVPISMPMHHNRTLLSRFRDYFDPGLNRNQRDTLTPIHGSTDMGNVSQVIPSIHPLINVSENEIALHSAAFSAISAEKNSYLNMEQAALAMIWTIQDIMSDNKLFTDIKKEFYNRRR